MLCIPRESDRAWTVASLRSEAAATTAQHAVSFKQRGIRQATKRSGCADKGVSPSPAASRSVLFVRLAGLVDAGSGAFR